MRRAMERHLKANSAARAVILALVFGLLVGASSPAAAGEISCNSANTVIANVVVLDQPIQLNRLGANIPGGMIYALARDVVSQDSGGSPTTDTCWFDASSGSTSCEAGKVQLRPGKRPRPLVLRVAEGDCLEIVFTNLLSSSASTTTVNQTYTQPSTRTAGLHVEGLGWATSDTDDGSFVGTNTSSVIAPGADPITYKLVAEHEGSYFLYNPADDWTALSGGGGGDGGTLTEGLFGAVNVQPACQGEACGETWKSEFYRSQVTEQELCLANDGSTVSGGQCTAPAGTPVLHYNAAYPAGYTDPLSGVDVAGLPVLDMVCPAAVAGKCLANELVYSDLTALVTGPDAGFFQAFGDGEGTSLDQTIPSLRPVYSLPDRYEPYREFTIIYHESYQTVQAFPAYFRGSIGTGGSGKKGVQSVGSVSDAFGINYSFGGLGSPIIANRLEIGPVNDCVDCKYEEFFLSSWTMGDPGMPTKKSAFECIDPNTGLFVGDFPDADACNAYLAEGNYALYPDDPSNVYHSYMSDHVRFRVLHAGPDLHHLHHQHAHQWIGSPNTPDGDYLDSQSIGPGSAFTLDMVYNGSGNVNQTVGDSIFHCHFYPHFASGMWGLWRVHDVLETGTELVPGKTPTVEADARALPDKVISSGTPIPAITPLPKLAMAPQPAAVRLRGVCTNDPGMTCAADSDCGGGSCQMGRTYCVEAGDMDCLPALGSTDYAWNDLPGEYQNPGYPFFIPGIAGSRAPHPPLDFAYAYECSSGHSENGQICDPGDGYPPSGCECKAMDGGLPRSLITSGDADYLLSVENIAKLPTEDQPIDSGTNALQPFFTVDFSKTMTSATGVHLPEDGTLVEKIAMAAHATRNHASKTPEGDTATFILNGLAPVAGAPYADPCIQFGPDGGAPPGAQHQRYLGVDLQLDAIFNKAGWHFPQQRIISLWGDAYDTLNRQKPPEPLFMRVNSYDCVDYVLANLMPNVYELDDFQVRTPTDILGQHIHLVKFDVTSSDGAANGWNYEDGTFAPNEVTERIDALTSGGGLYPAGGGTPSKDLTAKSIAFFGDGPDGRWKGSQATVQRWYDDPLLNNNGVCEDGYTACRYLGEGVAAAECGGGACYPDAGTCSEGGAFCHLTAAAGGPGSCAEGLCIPAFDRTIRTVFTHDHFSPSTHQQTGLYAGLVVEPRGSTWLDNATGDPLGTRPGAGATFGPDGTVALQDGGPTSWEAVIENPQEKLTYREFLLEFQDTALFYTPFTTEPFTAAAAQFKGSNRGVCDGDPSQPCGFCSNNGTCSNDLTKSCVILPPVQAGNMPPQAIDQALSGCGVTCSSGTCSNDSTKTCTTVLDCGVSCDLLSVGLLTACTPTDLSGCNELDLGNGSSVQVSSCNFIAGIPSTSWDAGYPIDISNGGGSQFVETITFAGATNNFSVNYRNEPLYARTTDPATGQPLSGQAGDLSYAYSSLVDGRPPQGGYRCSGDLSTTCSGPTDTSCASGSCEVAGFCSLVVNAPGDADGDSSSYNLCTASNTTLCPSGATCTTGVGVGPYPALTPGIGENDPFTPMLRAYGGDDVQIRTLVGAHINPHNFTIHGMNWLVEPSFVDSGWRNSMVMGISEHFELVVRVPPVPSSQDMADYLYQPGAAAIEQASGNWGLIRSYAKSQDDLVALSNNQSPQTVGSPCPDPDRTYEVVALSAQQALDGPLVFNSSQGKSDPQALIYFDLNDPGLSDCSPEDFSTCKYSGQPSPLVLRAAAGECVGVTLYNALDAGLDLACSDGSSTACTTYGDSCGGGGTCYYYGYCSNATSTKCTLADASTACGSGNTCDPVIGPGRASQQTATNLNGQPSNPVTGQSNISATIGLHAQLVHYDVAASEGANIGQNPAQTAAPGGNPVTYTWYAGNLTDDDGLIPIEFGAANLLPSDVMNHHRHALYGGLIIEPAGSKWCDPSTPDCSESNACGASAIVHHEGGMFREFVVMMADEGNPAINYGVEPLSTAGNCGGCAANDVSCALSAGCVPDPATPTFAACAGDPIRFRVLSPGGLNTNNVFEIYGHSFPEIAVMTPMADCAQGPYDGLSHVDLHASQIIGTESLCGSTDWQVTPVDTGLWKETLNDWKGSRMGQGPTNHFDAVIDSAGGPNQVPGDYLYRSYTANQFVNGLWGIFRVCGPGETSSSECEALYCSGP